MKAVVAAFNQEKALVGAFSVITNLRMVLFEALPGLPLLRLPLGRSDGGVADRQLVAGRVSVPALGAALVVKSQ